MELSSGTLVEKDGGEEEEKRVKRVLKMRRYDEVECISTQGEEKGW